MKKFLLLGAIAMVAFSVSAQRDNENNSSRIDREQLSSYNLIGVSYDNTHLGGKDYGYSDEESLSLNGFGLEYTHGFGLSRTLPMYLEIGLKWNMGFGAWEPDDYDYEKNSYQMMRFNVPVSYAWRFAIGENFSVTPYAGIDFRFNAMGRTKFELDDYEEDEWVNLFDKDDMYGDTWNRFQMGWHVGVRAEYSHVFLGVNYGTDFIKAYSKHKSHVSTGNLNVSLGYRF